MQLYRVLHQRPLVHLLGHKLILFAVDPCKLPFEAGDGIAQRPSSKLFHVPSACQMLAYSAVVNDIEMGLTDIAKLRLLHIDWLTSRVLNTHDKLVGNHCLFMWAEGEEGRDHIDSAGDGGLVECQQGAKRGGLDTHGEYVDEQVKQLCSQWLNGDLVNVGVLSVSDVLGMEFVDCLLAQVRGENPDRPTCINFLIGPAITVRACFISSLPENGHQLPTYQCP
jgi:hypothetical protein